MTMTKSDTKKVNFLKSLSGENYSLRFAYYRPEDVTEIIRHNYLLPRGDEARAIKVDGIDYILFITKQTGLVIDYACIKNGDKYELYEMNLATYNQYEEYMRQ